MERKDFITALFYGLPFSAIAVYLASRQSASASVPIYPQINSSEGQIISPGYYTKEIKGVKFEIDLPGDWKSKGVGSIEANFPQGYFAKNKVATVYNIPNCPLGLTTSVSGGLLKLVAKVWNLSRQQAPTSSVWPSVSIDANLAYTAKFTWVGWGIEKFFWNGKLITTYSKAAPTRVPSKK